MKKVMFLIVFMLGAAVFATEDAVKNSCMTYIKAMQELDFEAALQMMHADYTSVNINGKKQTYKDSRCAAENFIFWKKCAQGKLSLVEMYEFNLQFRGEKLSDRDRKALQEMENTGPGKELKQRMAKEFQRQLDAIKQEMDKALEDFKLISCRVDGDRAVLIYSMRDLGSKKIVRSETVWRKVDKKWLIVRTVDTISR